MRQQRPDQIEGINKLALKARTLKKLVFQLATGGGKTVCFAGLCQRFISKQQTRTLILVHRKELLKQARKTLFDWYEIVAIPITANHKYFPNAQIYVAMVETAHNRLKKNKNYFGDVGLVIVDECHIGNFKKLYSYFPESIIIGFTATPISSSRKDPLKNYFEDIVCGIDIPELIELWKQDATKGLVPNRTINVTSVHRSELAVKNGEFDDTEMSRIYSSTKHVHNCLAAYQKHCLGKKTLIFNCNIEHSQKVTQAFQAYGYASRHLDGETDDIERDKILRWFAATDNAILNNVGVLTTGFDEPSICCIIVNKSTMSLPLWLQMTGRGSRPYPGKEEFVIVDMGENALSHGDWCDSRNWTDIFRNPPEPKPEGEAPVKICVGCDALIHASQIICKYCGAENRKKIVYDDSRISYSNYAGRKNPEIDVAMLVRENGARTRKDDPTKPISPYYTLHQMRMKIVYHVRKRWNMRSLDDKTANILISLYEDKAKEWCAITEKPWNGWHRSKTREWMLADLKKEFGWEPTVAPIEAYLNEYQQKQIS